MHTLLSCVCLLVEVLRACDCQNRIIDGLEVHAKEHPYMFSLLYKPEQFFCGGSLIGRKHVITAAHCFNQNRDFIVDSSTVYVAGGDLNKYKDEDSSNRIKVDIDFAVIHPKFDIDTFFNDICILQLAEEVETNDYIKIIRIANKVPEAYSECTVIGWGKTSEDDYVGSFKLLQTTISIMPFEKCKVIKELAPVNETMMICAGDPNGRKDSCQGDSGGPLICQGKQVGIVSFGEKCGQPGFYGIYTRLTAYRDWINSIRGWDGSMRTMRGKMMKFRKSGTIMSTNINWYMVSFIIGVQSSRMEFLKKIFNPEKAAELFVKTNYLGAF